MSQTPVTDYIRKTLKDYFTLKQRIKNVFCEMAGHPCPPPNLKEKFYYMPAVELEKSLMLTGISKRYNMPEGLSAKEIEQFVLVLLFGDNLPRSFKSDCYKNLASEVEKINPDLAALSYDRSDTRKALDLIHGATSGLNPSDIQYHLDGNLGYVAEQDPQYKSLRKKIEHHAGIHIQWIPSIPTLQKIKKQLEERQQHHASSQSNGSKLTT